MLSQDRLKARKKEQKIAKVGIKIRARVVIKARFGIKVQDKAAKVRNKELLLLIEALE